MSGRRRQQPGGFAPAHHRAGRGSACAASKPITWISTRSTARTRRSPSTRPCAPSTTSCARGKVRYIGSTTFAGWQVVEALWASEKLHLNRFVLRATSLQSPRPPHRAGIDPGRPDLRPGGDSRWSPIGGGLLSGKYQRGQPISRRCALFPPRTARRWAAAALAAVRAVRSPAGRFVDEIYDVIEPLTILAAEKGVPLSQLALAWVVQQPGVTSPIVGPRTLDQLEDVRSKPSTSL